MSAWTNWTYVAATPVPPVPSTPPTPVRGSGYRCGLCRQHGHNRSTCPHSGVRQIQLTAEFNEARRLEYVAERARARQVAESIWQARPATPCPPCNEGPSNCKIAIQNILFENAEKIPDGIYKELMDALLIKD